VAKNPKSDWLDFLALTLAAYQLILPAVLAILGVAVLVVLLLRWLMG